MTEKKFTAKVFVSGVADAGEGQKTLTFNADYADGRNKTWAKYTPSLNYQMTVLDEVAEGVEFGQRATVTFDFSEE